MTTTVSRRYSWDAYVRTGRLVALDGVEHKFNPNHDPETGRFTFASGGDPAVDSDGGRRDDAASKPKTTFRKVTLTPEEYNEQARTLWGGMEGNPHVGFRNDKESNAGGNKVQQVPALSNANVEAPADTREAVVSVADSTRKAKLDGDQHFEKTLTFERAPDGEVVVASMGLPGPQGGNVPGITSKTIAVAHVHYAGMDQSPFKGDNSPVLSRDLPSFVIEGETGRIWEIGRQNGRYVQRTIGKDDKVGNWQSFQR